ncbi:MAG TPA: hypothetical protein PLW65_27460 [Pseudomonadota bacterium]|nr:hypothetical protein [Pseudomonadota bacterium]
MFPGLTGSDFECYEPRKWKSNVYNRERMEVRQKLLAVARQCSGELCGSDGAPLFIEASVEHPALWNHKQVDTQSVYFSRTEAARKELDGFIDRQKPIASLLDDPTPQRNHLFLAITISHEALEVSLKLHPDASVDRQNLERKSGEHYEAERLLGLLAELPPEFRIGVTPELREVAGVDAEALHELLTTLPPGSSSGGANHLLPVPGQPVVPPRMFYLGRSLTRPAALALSAAEQEAWVHKTLAELLPVYRFIVWSRDNDFVSMRQVLDKERTVRRQKGLHKNDRVRIVRGMLAGKDGLVQEVEAKGQLKVLVGKMVIKIDAADVERPDA